MLWPEQVRAIVVFVVAAVVAPLLALTSAVGSLLFLPLSTAFPPVRPGVEARITRITDVHGDQLGVLRQFETTLPVTRQDIPRVLKEAVVSVEDRRFYSHRGVDVPAAFRALWADLRGGRYVQGASTISQQYVKLAYTGRRRTLGRKLREAVLARQLERSKPKDEILYRYLSRVYFGGGAYGVGAAAESYFRKPVNQLTLSEAALLAGLIQAPTYYEPRSNRYGAEDRRLEVLQKMLDQGRITQTQFREAASQRIVPLLANRPPPTSPATLIYPLAEQQQVRYPYFVDYVRRYLIARYGSEKVYRGGLRVQTTIDPALQDQAQTAVANALGGTSPPLDMALVSVEPTTGYVKALVGGRDFGASQVNLALGNCVHAAKATDDGPVCVGGGGSGRQPGSSFKPFTLAKAFEKGLSPESAYSGPASYTFPGCHGSGCTVHNVEERGGFGRISLRQATWHSVNTVYAQLVRDVGIKDTAEMAHRLGITMVNADGRQNSGEPYGPSLTLGAAEVSPLDMAAGYSVFAARGMQAPATPLLKVTDGDGTVLEDNTDRKPKKVLSTEVADNVTDVLRGVIASGTGRKADIGRPAAGKTGTSEDYGDAWFIGFTPALATSVWMGYSDSRQHPLINVKGVDRVYGGTIPAQTWHDYMSEALKNVPPTDFNQPAPILPVADQLARIARGGFDPGDPRPVLGVPPTSVPLLAPPPVGAPSDADAGYVPYQDLPTTVPAPTETPTTPTTKRPFSLFGSPPPPTTTP